jgi:hypothetical protein
VNPIVVAAPPRSAYNPNRRVSDLLVSQLKHFQHVELKRGDLGIDPELARNSYTEGGAAQYIAAATSALRSRAPVAAAPPKLTIVSSIKSVKKPRRGEPLSIAAAASETTSAAPKRTSARRAARESSAQPAPKPGAGNNKGKR